MVISKTLADSIEKGNLIGIYSAFYTIAHEDPNFSTGKFEETLAYVKSKNIPGLMQEYNQEAFEPEENWDEGYWALVASELVDNFCMERIDHLKQVGLKVYPRKERTVVQDNSVAAGCVGSGNATANRQSVQGNQSINKQTVHGNSPLSRQTAHREAVASKSGMAHGQNYAGDRRLDSDFAVRKENVQKKAAAEQKVKNKNWFERTKDKILKK